MARVKISDTTPGGSGEFETPYTYSSYDRYVVLHQTGADPTKPPYFINRMMSIKVPTGKGSNYDPPIGYNTTVLAASKPDGTALENANSLVALPCPPFCGEK